MCLYLPLNQVLSSWGLLNALFTDKVGVFSRLNGESEGVINQSGNSVVDCFGVLQAVQNLPPKHHQDFSLEGVQE